MVHLHVALAYPFLSALGLQNHVRNFACAEWPEGWLREGLVARPGCSERRQMPHTRN